MAESTWTFFEGEWHPGNVRMMGPRTHGAWLGSTVFNGARAFEGVIRNPIDRFRRPQAVAFAMRISASLMRRAGW